MSKYKYELTATMLKNATPPTLPPEYGTATVTYAQLADFVKQVDGFLATVSGTEIERGDRLENAIDTFLAGLSGYTGPTEVICNGSEPIGDVWNPTLGLFVHPGQDVHSDLPLIVIAQDRAGVWWQAHVSVAATRLSATLRPPITGKSKLAVSETRRKPRK